MDRQVPDSSVEGKKRFSFRRSSAAYFVWGLLYLALGIYRFTGHEISKLFGEMILFDVLTNFISPFVFFGVILATAAWKTRTTGTSPAVVVFALLFGAFFIGIPVVIVFNAAGWGLAAALIFFFIKIDWLRILNSEPRMLRIFLARILLGPLVCAAPGYATTWLLNQNTFEASETDWVPMFGFLYFTLQGAIEEISRKRAAAKRVSLKLESRT